MSSINLKLFYLLIIIFLFTAISFSAPAGTVTLNSPADGTTNIQTPVSMVWTSPTNTDFYLYTIQIATDASFQAPIVNENTTTTIYSVSRNLTSNTKYFWRVLAMQKINLNSPTIAYYISNPWVFYTGNISTLAPVKLPAVPVLLAPTNNLTNVPQTARLTWKTALYATSYSVQVSTDARFITSAIKISTDNILDINYDTGYISGTLEPVLKPGTRYFWRVRSANSGGNSGWSNYYSFLTTATMQVIPPPTSVNLLSPNNGVTYNTDNTQNITFAWGTSPKATSYTLQISSDNTFTTIKKSVVTTLSSNLMDISVFEASRLYWRVLSTNASGSSLSVTRTFTVMPSFLISPLNNSTIENDGNSLQFTWDSVHYVDDSKYVTATYIYDYDLTLQYADNPNFTNMATKTLSNGATSTTIVKTAFNQGITYYWRLKLDSDSLYIGAAGNNQLNTDHSISYTPYRSFKIIPKPVTAVIPTAPVLDKPANNTVFSLDTTLNVDAPIALNWSVYEPGVTYTLKIASDNAFTNVETSIDINTLSTSISRTLLPVGDHYWRVTATNVNGSSKSEIRKFTIKKVTTTTAFNASIINLNSPATGSIVSASSVVLSWKEINNPTIYGDLKYNVQISQNINMTTPILDTKIASPLTGGLVEYGIGSDFGTTKAILLPLTTYYWRVNLNDGLTSETTNWSTVWSFTTEQSKVLTAPNVPSLVSPANTATGVGLTPTFYWNAVDKADYYHFQLSTSNTFASILLDKDQVTSISMALPTALNLNTNYYWRVQAINIIGISAYTVGQFTTRDTPEAPTLLTPANNSTTGSDLVVFSWNAINGVISYKYDLSSDSNFANILLTQTINAPTTTATITNADVSFVRANRYYWRVFGRTNAGVGQVSPVWSFTVQTDYSPANAAINIPIKPVLSWPIPSATINVQISYQLQIATSYGFDYVLYSKTGLPANSLTVAAADTSAILSYNTTYYWRVKSVVNGVAGAWSFPYRFTTIASPISAPGTVTLLTPADSITNVNVDNSLVLNWNAGLNAASYSMQMSTSANFSAIVLSQTGIATTSYALTTAQCGLLFPNTNYYWRIRTENSAGSSAWSAYFKFTTKPFSVVILSRPILTLPADNFTRTTGTVDFSYGPVYGATQYNLVIATSPDFNINSIVSDTTTSGTANLSKSYSFSIKKAYYWRVKAIRDLDTTDGIIDGESEFSVYRKLIIQ